MTQILTIHRTATHEWAARDVTGATYGQSPDIFEAIEAAERLAARMNAKVMMDRDAQNHLLTQASRKPKSGH